jgi:hypothetical protein
MDRSDFRLRSLLIDIDRNLKNDERKTLCFLIGCEDVPRRLIDAVSNDSSTSMHEIWETLFDRRKITVNNVNYLVERLIEIERIDLAERLKNYCPVPFSLSATPTTESGNRMQQHTNPSQLFTRINP